MPSVSLRIIGGVYNGKKINFPATLLRPSGGRVRESLFSCLGQQLHESTCLDLFAGTGALGLSAISRGARQVVFVEKNRQLATNLKSLTDKWRCPATVFVSSAKEFLKNNTQCFDIIFLDPPFDDYDNNEAWHTLLVNVAPFCTENTQIYCESNRFFTLTDKWNCIRQRKIGNVHWQLLNPIL